MATPNGNPAPNRTSMIKKMLTPSTAVEPPQDQSHLTNEYGYGHNPVNAYYGSGPTPATLTPKAVAKLMLESGVHKHRQRLDVLFFKAFLAGVYLSFGGLLDVIISGGSGGINASNPGLVKVLGGFVFPVGLTMIVLTGAELLTSDMMVFIFVVLKRRLPWWALPWNWFVVFWGNLVGSLFFGAILTKYAGVISDDPYRSFIQKFVVTKMVTPGWHQIFLRGIGCNWLVCIAVWQAAGSNETISKIYALWIPIWVFVACGYDHVVANMFSIPTGIMLGADVSSGHYIWKSLIPAFIGNAIGAAFVAVPAWWFYLRDEDTSSHAVARSSDVEKQPTEARHRHGFGGTDHEDDVPRRTSGDEADLATKVS